VVVDQDPLLRNEYPAAGHRIFKHQVKARLLLSDPRNKTFAEIGRRPGRKTLADAANAATPETTLGRYRKLVARKFVASKTTKYCARPSTSDKVEQRIVGTAKGDIDRG
jgi:putative transposase